MHPRTVAILIGAILVVSVGVRVLLFQGELLPLTDEAVLKRATSLTVFYQTANGQKALTVTRPEEVAELLSVLEMRSPRSAADDERALVNRRLAGGKVTFHFPDGTRLPLQFSSEEQLGNSLVSPSFYVKLCRYVSRVEGRAIHQLDAEPPGIRPVAPGAPPGADDPEPPP
jgi:hypothetical protein